MWFLKSECIKGVKSLPSYAHQQSHMKKMWENCKDFDQIQTLKTK